MRKHSIFEFGISPNSVLDSLKVVGSLTGGTRWQVFRLLLIWQPVGSYGYAYMRFWQKHQLPRNGTDYPTCVHESISKWRLCLKKQTNETRSEPWGWPCPVVEGLNFIKGWTYVIYFSLCLNWFIFFCCRLELGIELTLSTLLGFQFSNYRTRVLPASNIKWADWVLLRFFLWMDHSQSWAP